MHFLHISSCCYFWMKFMCLLIPPLCHLALHSICLLYVHLHLLLSVSCSQYLVFHLSKQWRPPRKPSLTPINWISNVKPNYARHCTCANSFHIHNCLCFIPVLDSVGFSMTILPPLLQCCVLHFISAKLQYSVPVCWLFCHESFCFLTITVYSQFLCQKLVIRNSSRIENELWCYDHCVWWRENVVVKI